MLFSLKSFEDTLESYSLEYFPQISENIKLFLVKSLPWFFISINLLCLLLFSIAPQLLFVLGVVFLIQSMLIPGLFLRKLIVWRCLFYATVIGSVLSVFILNPLSIISSTFVYLVFLLQIKKFYK